ncbi:MAG: SLC13 family permease [Gemmatimonadota bacterium]
MPADASAEAIFTLVVVAGTVGLFLWRRLRVEEVGLIVMAVLIVTGMVTLQEGLSGFANEATVTVALMLVLSIGLLRTGAIDLVGRWVGRLADGSESRLLVVVVLLVVPVSAFLNNTAVVAILLPTVLGLSRDMGAAPSRVLMPLSFASQMGGTLTLIGTSTNLLVAGLVLELGFERIRLFDVTPPALALTGAGILYLLTVGRWLTPTREPEGDLLKQYELREYLTGLIVEPGSRLAGRSLAEARFGEEYGLNVVRVERSDDRIRYPRGSTVLHEGDLLLVQGKIPDIAQIEGVEGLRNAGESPAIPPVDAVENAATPRRERTPTLAEVMVPPHSHLTGRTLKGIGFRARFGASALAIQRHGHAIEEELGQIPLETGDILLVQGPPEVLQELHDGRELSLLAPVEVPAKRRRKRRIAVAIMSGVVVLPALGLAPILVSALLGVILMLLSGCVTPNEVYDEIDWSVIVLLGSILPLGIAMQANGAADLLASSLLRLTEGMGPHGVLAAFYILAVVLTAVISNAAAAVVLAPMAMASASVLTLSPLPFVIAVMFGASNSYVTPIGYQTNLFIYGPGGYRFSDFLRVGGPLTILSIVVATYVIPLFFPFSAS